MKFSMSKVVCTSRKATSWLCTMWLLYQFESHSSSCVNSWSWYRSGDKGCPEKGGVCRKERGNHRQCMVTLHKKHWHHICVKNWYLREGDGVSDRMLFDLGEKMKQV